MKIKLVILLVNGKFGISPQLILCVLLRISISFTPLSDINPHTKLHIINEWWQFSFKFICQRKTRPDLVWAFLGFLSLSLSLCLCFSRVHFKLFGPAERWGGSHVHIMDNHRRIYFFRYGMCSDVSSMMICKYSAPNSNTFEDENEFRLLLLLLCRRIMGKGNWLYPMSFNGIIKNAIRFNKLFPATLFSSYSGSSQSSFSHH